MKVNSVFYRLIIVAWIEKIMKDLNLGLLRYHDVITQQRNSNKKQEFVVNCTNLDHY